MIIHGISYTMNIGLSPVTAAQFKIPAYELVTYRPERNTPSIPRLPIMSRIISCIVVIMIIAYSESMTCAASSLADLSILHGPDSSKKLIVFVHGFNSDPSSAWTNDAGISWPDLMRDDKNYHDYTVATYRYDTSLLNRTSSVEEIAVRMLRQIEDKGVLEKYKEVYFIAHSMGGLVVKRVLVDLHRPNEMDKLRKIKAVLFIATPVQGSNFAELASYLSFNPQLASLKPSEFNDFLQTLENQYQNLMRDRPAPTFPRSFCAYETKPTYGTVIVSRRDAATTCDQTPIAVDENHTNIVKPMSRDSTIYGWARARILETSILAEGPRLKFSIHRTPYIYKAGLTIEGVEWKEQYREYDLTIKNTSKNEGITDLRLRYTLPWVVITSRQASQQGFENLVLVAGEQDPFRVGRGNQITSLAETWTNAIEINATSLFPEAVFHGKLVMSIDDNLTLGKRGMLLVDYRDKSGVTKTSFGQIISVMDAATGSVRIEPEPLKGELKIEQWFQPKEPIRFPAKSK